MDLNDLLADVDGIGQAHAAVISAPQPAADLPAFTPAPAATRPVDLPLEPAPPRNDAAAPVSTPCPSLDLVLDVELDVMVEIGQARLPLRKLMAIQPGDSFTLDGRSDAPMRILVNEHLVAYGEPLVVDGALAIRITRLLAAETEE